VATVHEPGDHYTAAGPLRHDASQGQQVGELCGGPKRSLRGRPDSVAELISNYLNQWKKLV
jgi:hypothetical protein